MNKILYTFESPVSQKHLQTAKKILIDGGVIAYPTDVNWACGCLCDHKGALTKLQKTARMLNKQNPYTFIFSSLSQVSSFATIDNVAYRVLKKILPGPYTVVLKSHKRLPKIIEDKRKEVGVRIPDKELLLELTAMLPSPLASMSLSLPGQRAHHQDVVRPRFGYEILDAFGHMIDLILDLSQEIVYKETTLLRLHEGGTFELIRQGSQNPAKELTFRS
ncbi:MAG: L-threonylcarbamoyladenylate synthase [Proteobacteria bacterium]|nr:L-threonylcarbamoyladenylate synthase [Pseudomonadota bacterium]